MLLSNSNRLQFILLSFALFSLIACTSRVNEELRRAAIKGNPEAVRSLLSKGANLNYRSGGWTTLMFVAREGHTEVAKILLENGADPNAESYKDGTTVLTIVAENGHVEIVKLLLAHGVKVNARNDHGNTALMYAAELGHPEVAKVLLEAGADVTLKDKDNETALMIARRRGYAEISQLLEKAGAKE